MSNDYGLDTDYITKNLKKILLEIENYTPDEMFNALSRLSMVAATEAKLIVEIKVKNAK